METQVQKWGHSLALRIPSAFAKKTRIQSGSRVDLSEVKGQLVITLIEAEEPTLDMLLAGVTADNLHHEVTTGDAVGNETW
ncbi:MAG: AbrB/MazE/SpoVT family DNA-binding domain-containing protein [Steroidobacteraceae bacterium]|nr:AbrB/MazE/SpoVT family DNA-binding domain-containing protein [Deltaproteobacteria bacterium]